MLNLGQGPESVEDEKRSGRLVTSTSENKVNGKCQMIDKDQPPDVVPMQQRFCLSDVNESSLNLSPCEHFPFPKMKSGLKDKHFEDIEDVGRALQRALGGVL